MPGEQVLLRHRSLPLPPSRNPAPHRRRSRRPPATCTSRAAPSRRHIPPPPAYPGRTTARPARRCGWQRRRADQQRWSGKPRLRPAREFQSSVHPAALAAAANHLPRDKGRAGTAVAAIRVPDRLAINAMLRDFIMGHSTSLDWKLLGRSHQNIIGAVLGPAELDSGIDRTHIEAHNPPFAYDRPGSGVHARSC